MPWIPPIGRRADDTVPARGSEPVPSYSVIT